MSFLFSQISMYGLIVNQVDMLTLAMDEEPPHTILVATGDQDLSNALAVLRLRGFKIILVYPAGTQECLLMQSDESFSWHSQVLGRSSDRVDLSSLSSSPLSSPSLSSHSEIYCTTASLVNGNHSSTEACSTQADSHLKSATSRSHPRGFPLDVSSDTDIRLRRSNKDDAADLSLAALPAPSAPQSPSISTSPVPPSTTKSGAKMQASAISGAGFFPPPPSFPSESAGGPMIVISPSPLGNSTIFDRSEPKPEALTMSEVTEIPNSIQPKQEVIEALASATTAEPAPLSAIRSPDTPAPKCTKMTTHVTNHIESSAGGVLGGVLTSLSSTLGATTNCQPTDPSSAPVPASGPAVHNPSGSALSSVKSQAIPQFHADPPAKVVPQKFIPLVQILRQHGGTAREGQISNKIIQLYPRVYVDAGVQKWKRYVVKAVNAGIISKNGGLIWLKEEWLNSKISP